jgi:hypothetical protein
MIKQMKKMTGGCKIHPSVFYETAAGLYDTYSGTVGQTLRFFRQE